MIEPVLPEIRFPVESVIWWGLPWAFHRRATLSSSWRMTGVEMRLFHWESFAR